MLDAGPITEFREWRQRLHGASELPGERSGTAESRDGELSEPMIGADRRA